MGIRFLATMILGSSGKAAIAPKRKGKLPETVRQVGAELRRA